ncbi:MAG: autotransporter strand-loop-strand O-heptosyltransferase, partial [Caballeronia sp.]
MSESARASNRGRPEMPEGPSIPVLEGPEGIRFDFNYGCRVQVPVSGWRVKMFDSDTFNVLLNEQVEANVVIASMRKYYVRFRLEVFDGPRVVFSHTFNPTGKKIRLCMPPWALGDSIAWMPAIEAFRQQHQCEVHVPMGEHLQPLYRGGYPHLHLATETQLTALNDTYYATYYFGWIVPFFDRDHQPTDPRISSMQDTVAYQLGVPPGEY